MKIDGPLQHTLDKQIIFTIVMWLLVIAIAIACVYSKHVSRMLHVKIQTLAKENLVFQHEKGKLLLEKATWTANARLEQIAGSKLEMVMPAKTEIIKP